MNPVERAEQKYDALLARYGLGDPAVEEAWGEYTLAIILYL